MFKRFLKSELGIGLIENLVSISITSIVLASAASSMFMAFQGNKIARTYTSIVGDVQGIVDGLRSNNYSVILDKFSTPYLSISDGQTMSETIVSSPSRSSYILTYTAIKRSASSIPDAVKVQVQIAHQVGAFGANSYAFETIIAQKG